jgi:hypothetical protein
LKINVLKGIRLVRFDCAKIDSFIHLNEPAGSIILSAIKQKKAILPAIDSYLADPARGSFYSRLFLQSLRGCLNTPAFIDIDNIDRLAQLYQGLRIDDSSTVPWHVGLLQSLHHLIHDIDDYQVPPCTRLDKTAVLVSVFNEYTFSEICLKALRKYSGTTAHVIVINNSTDDISAFKRLVVERKLADVWIDSACNAHADGLNRAMLCVRDFRYLCTLDSDAIALRQGWLEEMLQVLKDRNAGIAGPQTFVESNSIKGIGIHPCCMVIDQLKLASQFQIDFCSKWPWDVGHLLTWDCIAHSIPIVYLSHDITKDYARGSSLINKSVRHFWYTSRILKLSDNESIDGVRVGLIRAKLQEGLQSQEIKAIDTKEAY